MRKLKSNLVKLTAEKRLYQIPVPIIGLTGGIGTGKSTVASLLKKHGLPIIDADQNVKTVYQKPETLVFIKKHFPSAIVDNQIDFKKLREIVFVNQESKQTVEDYIYMHLPSTFKEAYARFNNPPFIIYDVPLLFEKKLNPLVDVSVCVYAPRETQIQRLMARDHSTRELAEKILANQLDIEVKKELSDFTIENTGDLTILEKNVEEFLKNVLTN